MIEMPEQLRQAVAEHPHEPLRLLDPATQQTFVLLRADIYERLKEYDDGTWTDEEMDRLPSEGTDALGS